MLLYHNYVILGVMIDHLTEAYHAARTRLLLLDYDGVLAPIVARPELAAPTGEILNSLRAIATQDDTQLVVISGRDRNTLEQWLGSLPIDMSAEHGHFYKESGVWHSVHEADMSWLADVDAAMRLLVDKYPGSHIESKQASLVWHYRQAETPVDELDAKRQIERAAHDRAIVMQGKCVVDVRAPGADKGQAVRHWYASQNWDFVLCVGDDVTDEAMFAALPESAWTIKVGAGPTIARTTLTSQEDVQMLLRQLSGL